MSAVGIWMDASSSQQQPLEPRQYPELVLPDNHPPGALPPPVPAGLCLSIDVGSQHAGFMLWDGVQQQILYLGEHKLMAEHYKQVPDGTDVYQHLNAVWAKVQTQVQGRPYWVLIEHQIVEPQTYQKALTYLTQLYFCITTYFLCHGAKRVERISPTARLRFCSVPPSTSRYKSKQAVMHVLDQWRTDNTDFYKANKDILDTCYYSAEKRDDMADAIMQCMARHYSRAGDARARGSSAPQEQPSQRANRPSQQQQPPSKLPRLQQQPRNLPLNATGLHAELLQLLKTTSGSSLNKAKALLALRQVDKRNKFLGRLQQYNTTYNSDTKDAESLARALERVATAVNHSF